MTTAAITIGLSLLIGTTVAACHGEVLPDGGDSTNWPKVPGTLLKCEVVQRRAKNRPWPMTLM